MYLSTIIPVTDEDGITGWRLVNLVVNLTDCSYLDVFGQTYWESDANARHSGSKKKNLLLDFQNVWESAFPGPARTQKFRMSTSNFRTVYRINEKMHPHVIARCKLLGFI